MDQQIFFVLVGVFIGVVVLLVFHFFDRRRKREYAEFAQRQKVRFEARLRIVTPPRQGTWPPKAPAPDIDWDEF